MLFRMKDIMSIWGKFVYHISALPLPEMFFDSIKEKIETHDKFKYLDEPYLRFKDDEQNKKHSSLKIPSGNVIEIKTMRTPELLWADNS